VEDGSFLPYVDGWPLSECFCVEDDSFLPYIVAGMK
jgi:hypothetical protein